MLTVRTDVTHRMLIFSGRPLRSILAEYSASRVKAQISYSARVLARHRVSASWEGRRVCADAWCGPPTVAHPAVVLCDRRVHEAK